MNAFDGYPHAVPVKPGGENTTQLRNAADTNIWGLVLPKTINEALEQAAATLTWKTDDPAIRMLLTLPPTFR